ncbi:MULTISPECIES: hypothetical protein [unclassified Mesorhizobium]|uniref:hypothetical protein n=1 Tax=unclassified Mesorhizobium TaxID=325217 RepID=UPI00112D833A|nr:MULTISPECIES: hypothetical protein [unclassified Mesorhizobium]TPJ50629.1 hypothetical protein FJ426_24565 [Mesorhizobium sp. B2-6-4]TPM14019.1 hypothetical protein FJ953_26860 [Mesorhizobium sp. B2-3-6]
MSADAAEMEGESSPKPAGKVRLKTLDDLDRRTTAARVVFELRDSLAADLGGKPNLSVMKLELIDNVACLGAMLKDAAANYLEGEPIDINEFMALTNAQRRLLADLGLERRALKDITPSLKDYAATKYAGAAS